MKTLPVPPGQSAALNSSSKHLIISPVTTHGVPMGTGLYIETPLPARIERLIKLIDFVPVTSNIISFIQGVDNGYRYESYPVSRYLS
jgi:hypothetical protein